MMPPDYSILKYVIVQPITLHLQNSLQFFHIFNSFALNGICLTTTCFVLNFTLYNIRPYSKKGRRLITFCVEFDVKKTGIEATFTLYVKIDVL